MHCAGQIHIYSKTQKVGQNRVFGDSLNLLTLKQKFGTTIDFPEDLENSIRLETNILDVETYRNKLENTSIY